mmetsp:Transcript_104294/g.238804  ORF Transcript_104294/g.238804 Transcript_104294/m.238804 type:complete len:178 (-) Transcript_104294:230-763(-)
MWSFYLSDGNDRWGVPSQSWTAAPQWLDLLVNQFIYRTPVDEVLCGVIVRDLCTALKHIHAVPMIHRDVKAENVMLHQDGRAVLVDYGCAKLFQAADMSLAAKTHVGTPSYMAPEFVDGQYTDKVDVWSLGKIAFEMATGKTSRRDVDPRLGLLSRKQDTPERLGGSSSRAFRAQPR